MKTLPNSTETLIQSKAFICHNPLYLEMQPIIDIEFEEESFVDTAELAQFPIPAGLAMSPPSMVCLIFQVLSIRVASI